MNANLLNALACKAVHVKLCVEIETDEDIIVEDKDAGKV
jgi:hypothetical protein